MRKRKNIGYTIPSENGGIIGSRIITRRNRTMEKNLGGRFGVYKKMKNIDRKTKEFNPTEIMESFLCLVGLSLDDDKDSLLRFIGELFDTTNEHKIQEYIRIGKMYRSNFFYRKKNDNSVDFINMVLEDFFIANDDTKTAMKQYCANKTIAPRSTNTWAQFFLVYEKQKQNISEKTMKNIFLRKDISGRMAMLCGIKLLSTIDEEKIVIEKEKDYSLADLQKMLGDAIFAKIPEDQRRQGDFFQYEKTIEDRQKMITELQSSGNYLTDDAWAKVGGKEIETYNPLHPEETAQIKQGGIENCYVMDVLCKIVSANDAIFFFRSRTRANADGTYTILLADEEIVVSENDVKSFVDESTGPLIIQLRKVAIHKSEMKDRAKTMKKYIAGPIGFVGGIGAAKSSLLLNHEVLRFFFIAPRDLQIILFVMFFVTLGGLYNAGSRAYTDIKAIITASSAKTAKNYVDGGWMHEVWQKMYGKERISYKKLQRTEKSRHVYQYILQSLSGKTIIHPGFPDGMNHMYEIAGKKFLMCRHAYSIVYVDMQEHVLYINNPHDNHKLIHMPLIDFLALYDHINVIQIV